MTHKHIVSGCRYDNKKNNIFKMFFSRMPRQAGVFLLGTSGMIGANQVENMETACTIWEDKVIHPFAFRPHTHALGELRLLD